jgi:HTH-type transcriptional regulator / antitoxin HigA
MEEDIKYAKELLSPPGDTLLETLEQFGMTQQELAVRMGRPLKTINEIVKGKTAITPETAIQLERVLSISMSFWLNRERLFREEIARIIDMEKLVENTAWASNFPLKEMKKRNILPDTADKTETVNSLLSFFGIASPKEWQRIYMEEGNNVFYRKSLAGTSNPEAISVWLRMGELQVRQSVLNDFNKNILKDKLPHFKKLTKVRFAQIRENLINSCAEVGLALVLTPSLLKTSISGVTRWFAEKPFIQISDRYKTEDQFWFTFFHEIAHILLHGKKDVFIEGLGDEFIDTEKEEEANNWASNFLIKKDRLKHLTQNAQINDSNIMALANDENIDPGIVVGQYQHFTKDFTRFNSYKKELFFA